VTEGTGGEEWQGGSRKEQVEDKNEKNKMKLWRGGKDDIRLTRRRTQKRIRKQLLLSVFAVPLCL